MVGLRGSVMTVHTPNTRRLAPGNGSSSTPNASVKQKSLGVGAARWGEPWPTITPLHVAGPRRSGKPRELETYMALKEMWSLLFGDLGPQQLGRQKAVSDLFACRLQGFFSVLTSAMRCSCDWLLEASFTFQMCCSGRVAPHPGQRSAAPRGLVDGKRASIRAM